MDGIQTYHAPASPLTYGPPQSAGPAPYPVVPLDPASVKTPGDYLRALRRRFWLVLTVGLPLGVAVTVWVLKQPPQYLVEAVISITPPQSDPEFSSLVSHNPTRRDTPANERYAVDRMNRIKSRRLA